jgi:hypothetical protein
MLHFILDEGQMIPKSDSAIGRRFSFASWLLWPRSDIDNPVTGLRDK